MIDLSEAIGMDSVHDAEVESVQISDRVRIGLLFRSYHPGNESSRATVIFDGVESVALTDFSTENVISEAVVMDGSDGKHLVKALNESLGGKIADPDAYAASMERRGLKAIAIDSSIGLHGLIVCARVTAEPNP